MDAAAEKKHRPSRELRSLLLPQGDGLPRYFRNDGDVILRCKPKESVILKKNLEPVLNETVLDKKLKRG